MNKVSKGTSDFRGFLTLLEQRNQLIRIRKDVDPRFELAAIVAELDGKEAVTFAKVHSSKISVASNVCGTPGRFYLAIAGREPSDRGNDVKRAIHSRITQCLGNLFDPKVSSASAPFEKNSSRSLSVLPIVTHFEKDAGPFITSSIVYAKDQEKGNQNSSTHRLLLLDDRHMAIRMVEGRHLHKCFTHAKEHGEDLRVAIAVGGPSCREYRGGLSGGIWSDEMHIANSFLQGELTLSRTPYSKLHVPSHAEIVY